MNKWMKALLKRLLIIVSGGTQTLVYLIVEILQALLKRIAWQVVLERFLTRLLVGTLKWLQGLSSNRLVIKTVEDILQQLQETGLKHARL